MGESVLKSQFTNEEKDGYIKIGVFCYENVDLNDLIKMTIKYSIILEKLGFHSLVELSTQTIYLLITELDRYNADVEKEIILTIKGFERAFRTFSFLL